MKISVLTVALSLCWGLFARTINVEADAETLLSDALSGTEELVKTGEGTLVLGNANSGWTGSIDVREGTLQSAYANLGTTGDLRVRAGARLRYSDATVSINTAPTRHGYLAGTIEFADKVSFGYNTWYPFTAVTLEGDVEFVNAGKVVGWGSIDMAGHTITSSASSVDLPRMSIRNFGRIVKHGGYVNIWYQTNTKVGEGGSVELDGGATLQLGDFKNSRLACEIESVKDKNWIMVRADTGASTTNDNVFAGPIRIASGSELMTWAAIATSEVIVVEGPISGEGTFSTSSVGGTKTFLRGAESLSSDTKVTVNSELVVEQSRFANFCPKSVTVNGSYNLTLVDPNDNENLSRLADKTTVNSSANGRVCIRLTGEGENLYDGPFGNGLYCFESPNGTIKSTNVVTAAQVADVNAANPGTWILEGDPSASVELTGFYFSNHLVFRNMGNVTSAKWICSNLRTTRSNIEPYRLSLEGDTHLFSDAIYAGVGGDNGTGVITIDDPATAEGMFRVGTENNDRGAVYQNGGVTRHTSAKSTGWSGVGVKTTSTGAWIQRGGTNEVAISFFLGNTPHAYGAYVMHGGLLRAVSNCTFQIGSGGRGVFYQDGGAFTNGTSHLVYVNVGDYYGLVEEASFTLAGDAEFYSPKCIGTWKRDSLSRFNLNGGRLTVPYLYLCDDDYNSGNYKNGKIHLGFNGGTLSLVGDDSTDFIFGVSSGERSHPTSLTIYEGGATIETIGRTRQAMFGFSAPTGLGVKSVTLPEEIGGVALADLKATCPLKFFFVGGNGSADAIVDFDDRTGRTLGVKVLSSGFGYTEAPRAFVVAPGGLVTNECVVEMFEPRGGGLTKKGAATLWLDKENSYSGPTVIAEGMLRYSAGCIPPAADITIAEGAQFWPEKNATDNVIDTLRGTGVGWYDVTLTNRLVVSYADAAAGKAMRFRQGAITSQGAKVVVSDPERLTADARSVKILTADNGILGSFAWTLGDEATGRGWRLKQNATTLRLVNRDRIFAVIVR